MKREFEILYQAPGVAELKTVKVIAALEKDARKAMPPEFKVESVSVVRIAIDPNQVYFRVEEAAEYLRMAPSTFYEKFVESGKLPKATNGNPIYHRKQLDAIALEGMSKIEVLRKAA